MEFLPQLKSHLHRNIDREIAEGIACGDIDPVEKKPFTSPAPAAEVQLEEGDTGSADIPPAELAEPPANDNDAVGEVASSSRQSPSTSFTLFAQYGTLRVR